MSRFKDKMKRVFIIHGWSGRPNGGWLSWLNKELTAKGFKVFAPFMPDSENPKIETWVPYLAKLVGKADKETFFVGHSIGCQTVIRYIESLPEKTKVGGVFFVGGWFNLKALETEEEKRIAKPWLDSKIDFNKVRPKIEKAFALFSEDDPYVPIENAKMFKEKLGAKVVIEKDKGHYTGDVTPKIQVLLEEMAQL